MIEKLDKWTNGLEELIDIFEDEMVAAAKTRFLWLLLILDSIAYVVYYKSIQGITDYMIFLTIIGVLVLSVCNTIKEFIKLKRFQKRLEKFKSEAED